MSEADSSLLDSLRFATSLLRILPTWRFVSWQSMNSFFAAVTYVDDLIGEVLEAVVDNDLDENTIIALIGDHGWTLGENQVRIPIPFLCSMHLWLITVSTVPYL